MKSNLILIALVFSFFSTGYAQDKKDADPNSDEQQVLAWGQLPSSVQRALAQQNLRDVISKITMQAINKIVTYQIFTQLGDQSQVFEVTISGKVSKIDPPASKGNAKEEKLITWKDVPTNIQQIIQSKLNRDTLRKVLHGDVSIDDKDPTTPDKRLPAYIFMARNQPEPLFIGEDGTFLKNAAIASQKKTPSTPLVEKTITWSQLPSAVQQSLGKEGRQDDIYRITVEQQGSFLNYRIRTLVNDEKVQYVSNVGGKLTKVPVSAASKAKPPSSFTWKQIPETVKKTILAKTDRLNVRKIRKGAIDDNDPNTDNKIPGYIIDVVQDGVERQMNIAEDGTFITFLAVTEKTDEEESDPTEKLLTWNDLAKSIQKTLGKLISRDDLQVIIAEGKSKSRIYHAKLFSSNQIQDLKMSFNGKVTSPLGAGQPYGDDPLLTWNQLSETAQTTIGSKAQRDDIRRIFKTEVDREPNDPASLPAKIPVILVEVDKKNAAVKELVLYEDGKFRSFIDKPETEQERLEREQEEQDEEQAAQEAEEEAEQSSSE